MAFLFRTLENLFRKSERLVFPEKQILGKWTETIEAVLRYTVMTTLLFGRVAVVMHVIVQLYGNTAKQEFYLLHLI